MGVKNCGVFEECSDEFPWFRQAQPPSWTLSLSKGTAVTFLWYFLLVAAKESTNLNKITF